MHDRETVLILGGGLAGLACARALHARGVPYRILEASDALGGRVRTDVVDGFLLDRGFQVLLTAYPEAQAQLDLDALDMRAFYPGALVHREGRVHRLADPLRHPLDGVKSLFGGLGSARDKLRMLSLRGRSRAGSLDELATREETSAAAVFEELGFSPVMRDAFLRPWLGGAFLEREMRTSSRWLDFVFRMFSDGDTAVPARGMGAIPAQLAGGLDAEAIALRTRVVGLDAEGVHLENGDVLPAHDVVVAMEGPAAARLLGDAVPSPGSRESVTLSFAAEQDPVGEPILSLDGDGTGPVNHLAVMSSVAPSYAPSGAALVVAGVVDDDGTPAERLEQAARAQLRGWFGPAVDGWRLLRVERIPHALPETWGRPLARALPAGVHVCGDWRESPSIQGALKSGRLVGEQLAAARAAAALV